MKKPGCQVRAESRRSRDREANSIVHYLESNFRRGHYRYSAVH
jgi:hypothetical protein